MKQLDSTALNIDRPGIIPLLIMVQLIVLFPLWLELPLWVVISTLLLLGLKYLDYRYKFKLPSFIVLIGVMAAFAGVFYYFRTISGREAGVSLICLMYSFKLLETKSFRDATLVLFISFFIMVMAFLFNQSLVMGVYLLITVLAILFGLLALNSTRGIAGIKGLGKTSGAVLLQAIPIMLALFFLFPRLPGPLWSMPNSSQGATGISDSMSPGDIGVLSTSDEPAFRVKFDGAVPSADDMYWRGMVFTDYDGFTWKQGIRAPIRRSQLPHSKVVYRYKVQMEPNKARWVFGLEQLAEAPKDMMLFNDYTWRKGQRIMSQISFTAKAVRFDYSNVVLDDYRRMINLQLPRQGNQRTRQWARELYSRSRGTEDFIQKVLSEINQKKYYYTLTPEVLEREVVDGFWFDTQEGFCEHYSGAFVFIMRAAGIPARVVTGYQGGEYNPYGDYYLLRQSDAHAWTEVWVNGKGWVRVDPTAAIHPSRVEQDLRSRTYRRDTWLEDKVIGFDVPSGWLNELKMRWDAVQSFWDDTLMGYGQDEQNDWLKKLGIESSQWRYLAYGLVAVFLTSGLLFGLWLIRKNVVRDPVERMYLKLKQKLVKQGLVIDEKMGPKTILLAAREQKIKGYKYYHEAIQLYIRLRYQDSSHADCDKKLSKELLKQFKASVLKI